MQRLAQAEDRPPLAPPPLSGLLSDLSFEQAVAMDLSRLFLSFDRFAETISLLGDIDHPSARNNLALARFALGEITAAREGFMANWQQNKRNLFALHQAVRLQLWTNGLAAACELRDALHDAQPLRGEDAYGKMLGLLLLGEEDNALDTWHTVREAGFWHEGDHRRSSCAYFAGVAALRTNDIEAANTLFSEALRIYPDNLEAEMALMSLSAADEGEEDVVTVGAFRDWFPQTWLAEIQAEKTDRDAILGNQFRRCDAHADYLSAAVELGGAFVRFYAMSALKSRSLNGDRTAIEALRNLLCRPCGADRVRLDLDRWLQNNGLVVAGQPHRLRLHGKVQELALRPMRLHENQIHLGLPAASQARLEKMHQRLTQDNLDDALLIAEELVASHPDHPVLISNLASIKDALDFDLEEIETLYRHAAEIDPTYLFAQAGLARIAARKGNMNHARELLNPLQGREEYHVSEWRALLRAEREIAVAQQNMTLMFTLDDALDLLDEQFG